MTRHTDVSAGNKHRHQKFSPVAEVVSKLLFLAVCQYSEPRQWVTLAASDLWRQTPDTTAAGSQLGQFLFTELQDAVRRICADRMNGVSRLLFQPLKAIRMFDSMHSCCAIQISTIGERQASAKLVSTIVEMDAKVVIGRLIRQLREEQGLTQDQLASQVDLTYQYLSGVENGRENFSIGVVESLAEALKCPLHQLVARAFADASDAAPAAVNPAFFRPSVPLPPRMTIEHLKAAVNATQSIVATINANLARSGAKALTEYIQGNNFSGLVSNVLCDALHDHSPYKHNSHQAYPDLINPQVKERGKPVGLEVKSTIQIGKGGESHNGHSGWHLIACFHIEPTTGNVRFIQLMFAVLNGHGHAEPDWTYVGSKVNESTGSRRTETYNTNLIGTTKLRDGSVYLDPGAIDYKRWRQQRRADAPPPEFSIFRR
jgi:transcriptional regulator with XRE-family HTH domain